MGLVACNSYVRIPHYTGVSGIPIPLVHRRGSADTLHRRTWILSFCVCSYRACPITHHHRKFHVEQEPCEQEQARTRCWGSSEDPWPNRAGPNFLWLGFAHAPSIFQRPSALILPGQRIPSAFTSPWREEFHHGGKGKWWGSPALNHRQEAGRTGETESDQLPSTAWVAVRGRKENTVILNCHTCSCLLWLFSRK